MRFAKLHAWALILTGSIALAGGTMASAKEVTLRLASAAPEKSIWTEMMRKYKERVTELTAGEVVIEIYPNGQLGSMDDTLSQMLRGRLDIYTGSTPYLASVVPELSVLTLPYLFESTAQSVCVIPKIAKATAAAMADKGEFVAYVPVGWMNISSNKPVRVPADMAGLKIRSNPQNVSNILITAYGANPVPIAPAETASALSTGLVSGGDNALAFWASTGQSRVSTHYLQIRHYLNTSGIVIGKRSWDKLSASQRDAVRKAADVLDYGKLQDMLTGFENKLIETVGKSGATVSEPTDAEIVQWRKVGLSTWDEILKGANQKTRNFLAEVQKAKAGC